MFRFSLIYISFAWELLCFGHLAEWPLQKLLTSRTRRRQITRPDNFIKGSSHLTERLPLDVIIKRNDGLQAVCNQAVFACIWTLCHIYCKDERLGMEWMPGSINLTQHFRAGTLIIPSMENHAHHTQGHSVHTWRWSLDVGMDRGRVSGSLSTSTPANTSSLIQETWNGSLDGVLSC